MRTAIEDLGDILQSAGFGELSKDIWLNRLPDSPDDVITIFQGGGRPQNLQNNTFYPSFQIRTRSKSSAIAVTLISSIFKLLQTQRRVQAPSGRVFLVQNIIPPNFYDTDESNRSSYIINVDFCTTLDI